MNPVATSSSREAKRRPRASGERNRVRRILQALKQSIPSAAVELDATTPLELLVATILSAQCTDQQVNKVTPALFRRYKTAKAFAEADPAVLETLIRPTGFYKNKAKHVVACGKALVERFGGRVPDTLETLTTLPGVGRKTANVILGGYFHKPAIVVDTHVARVARRLHLTNATDPAKIEYDLQRLIPRDQWTSGSQRLLLHGRYVCRAKRPNCRECLLQQDCPWEGKAERS